MWIQQGGTRKANVVEGRNWAGMRLAAAIKSIARVRRDGDEQDVVAERLKMCQRVLVVAVHLQDG